MVGICVFKSLFSSFKWGVWTTEDEATSAVQTDVELDVSPEQMAFNKRKTYQIKARRCRQKDSPEKNFFECEANEPFRRPFAGREK